MGDLLNDIGKLYDVRKFFFTFIILAMAFQVLAIYTYGSFYWYLGDYLWYMFIFVGLVDAIIIIRRTAKRSYVDNLEKSLGNYKENFISSLQLDKRIFDVEPTNIAVINDQPIRVEGRQEHLEKMKEFLDTVRRINQKIEDSWPDEKNMPDWDQKTDAQIFAELKISDTDIDIIAKSKESLKFWLASYNSNLKKLREVKEKKYVSIYEKGMIAVTPVILLVTIAVQLGNVTNKLLYHVFGG